MEQPTPPGQTPPGLSFADFEAIRLRSIMGDDQAYEHLAGIIRQNPGHFAGQLDIKAICLETMSRAIARHDKSLKRDVDQRFAERLKRFETDHPVDAMQRMLADVAAITALRAAAFEVYSQQPEHSDRASQAFMTIASKARAAGGVASKELWRPGTPVVLASGPAKTGKPKVRFRGQPRKWAAASQRSASQERG